MRVCVCVRTHEITAMCAGLLHAAVEAPAGLGRATDTGWRGAVEERGLSFPIFNPHYFNKVHIKAMITHLICRGRRGFGGASLQDVISHRYQHGTWSRVPVSRQQSRSRWGLDGTAARTCSWRLYVETLALLQLQSQCVCVCLPRSSDHLTTCRFF